MVSGTENFPLPPECHLRTSHFGYFHRFPVVARCGRIDGAPCTPPPCATRLVAAFATTYEGEGYDGEHKGSQWWFEAWGSGPKADWLRRGEIGRPPRPYELRRADYIVIGIRHSNGEVIYRTRTGGLDLDPKIKRRKKDAR